MSGGRNDKIKIRVGRSKNTMIVGVQEGPSTEEIVEAVGQALDSRLAELAVKSLLNLPKGSLSGVSVTDDAANELYVCSGTGGMQALGFAVNRSGLLICPSALGDLSEVRNLQSAEIYQPRSVEREALLQAVSIDIRTRGLVPAYANASAFLNDRSLFAFDRAGARVALAITALEISMIVESPNDRLQIEGAVEASFASSDLLMGGPVLTEAEEVFGVCVAAASLESRLYVQPWSRLPVCLRMDAEALADDGELPARCQVCGVLLPPAAKTCPSCGEGVRPSKG